MFGFVVGTFAVAAAAADDGIAASVVVDFAGGNSIILGRSSCYALEPPSAIC